MSHANSYPIGPVSVIDIVGGDAKKIVQNLTTNNVADLDVHEGRESFVTDVRGKTLGHVLVFGREGSLRMIGAPGQSEAIAAHVDRYTIREEATPEVLDERFVAIVLDAAASEKIGIVRPAEAGKWTVTPSIRPGVDAHAAPWLSEGSSVLLADGEQSDQVQQWLGSLEIEAGSIDEFHRRRIMVPFPWYGIDLDSSNLPQEADRDAGSISFTKGCYLGQETVARLDALGQVQRKLVRWSIRGAIPQVGTTVDAGEKTVGRLTSVAAGGKEDAIALGFARRSHFDAGSQASGEIAGESGGDPTPFVASVI